MAINPGAAFPTKTTPPSAQYPFGSARDVTSPGDGTGTPLVAAWLNDWFGLQQAALDKAGITPSGVSDAVGACQVLDALQDVCRLEGSAFLSQLIDRFGAVNAWVQAAGFRTLVIDREVTKTGTYSVPSGQHIIFAADLIQGDDLVCLDFTGSSFWALSGHGDIYRAGGKPTAEVAGSIGLKIVDCRRYSISGGIRVKWFKGSGYYLDGTTDTGSADVSHSSVAGLMCEENWYNFRFLNGFQAEYVTFTGCNSVRGQGCNNYHETGNIMWIGGSVSLSENGAHGVWLKHPTAGGNPHHGAYVGASINHNTGHDLFADEVAFNHNFIGCNFYDGGSSAVGDIYLKNSRGINLLGGTLGCDVRVEESGGPHIGVNQIANMQVIEGKLVITGGVLTRKNLRVRSCIQNGNDWLYNTIGSGYASAKPAANTPVGAASVPLAFSNELSDVTESYDAATGRFIAKSAGVVRASVTLNVTFAAGNAASTVQFLRDDTGGTAYTILGVMPLTFSGATNGFLTATFEIPVSKGAAVLFRYSAPAFATDAQTIVGAYSSVSFEMLQS